MLHTIVAGQSFVKCRRPEKGEIYVPGEIEHLQITANGLQFHVVAAGPADAPPILFLHGFPEGSLSWREVMQALSEYRVYAPDLRGYPGTESTRSGYDVITLTDDIRGLIEALKLSRPVLVSHDWGGAPLVGSLRIAIPT
jgi:pimeloyl-ACP methyl ester carboxylesterase